MVRYPGSSSGVDLRFWTLWSVARQLSNISRRLFVRLILDECRSHYRNEDRSVALRLVRPSACERVVQQVCSTTGEPRRGCALTGTCMVTSWGLGSGRFVPLIEPHTMRLKHVQFNNIFLHRPNLSSRSQRQGILFASINMLMWGVDHETLTRSSPNAPSLS